MDFISKDPKEKSRGVIEMMGLMPCNLVFHFEGTSQENTIRQAGEFKIATRFPSLGGHARRFALQ